MSEFLSWIDEIAKIFELSDLKGSTLKAYRAYEKNEFPETITAPCVLTWVSGMDPEYEAPAGPLILRWRGETAFFLVEGVEKAKYPYVLKFYKPILKAAVENMSLNGLVYRFRLSAGEGGQAIRGPMEMGYGDDVPRLGLMVTWSVEEHLSIRTGDITPAE